MRPGSGSAELEAGMAGLDRNESIGWEGAEAVSRAFGLKTECPAAARAGIGRPFVNAWPHR